MKKYFLNLFLIAAVISLGFVSYGNAETYPAKEIRLLVNYGAGGSTDLSTRVVAEAAEKFLGQSIQIVNKPGGSGTVGPTILSKSEPDGYTIGVTSFSPMAISPHTQGVPYKMEDFEFIGGFARYVYGIAVSSGSPYETVKDLIEASESGGRITCGIASSIGASLVATLEDVSGINVKMIRYKSDQEVSTAILSNTVDIMITNPKGVVPFVKTGQMRLIASASKTRWDELPEVPTLEEQGFEIVVESYAGLAAPAGIEEGKLQALEAAFRKGQADPKVKKMLKSLGMQPAYFSGAEYEKLLVEGYAAMGKSLAAAGLKTN